MREETIEAWADTDGEQVALHLKWTPDDELEFKLQAPAAERLRNELGRAVETARRTAAASAALQLGSSPAG